MAVCKKCWGRFLFRREGAYILDIILLKIVITAIEGLTLAFVPDTLFYGLPLLFIVLQLGLFVLRDSASGISPGKRLAGIQVVDATTLEPIGALASFKRNLVLAIPVLNIIFVLIALVQIQKGQRIGERWANTIVIWRKHAFRPPFDQRGINCLSCGYNLTGNVSGICPECGTPISTRPPAPPTQPTPEPAAAVSVFMTDNADHSDENLNG